MLLWTSAALSSCGALDLSSIEQSDLGEEMKDLASCFGQTGFRFYSGNKQALGSTAATNRL